MDLYANPKNHTEPLHCTPLDSCYAYKWHDCQLCWAKPPWSHVKKMVTKAVLDRAQIVVICPDWGQSGEMFGFRHAPRPPASPVGPDPRLWGHILLFVLPPPISLCRLL